MAIINTTLDGVSKIPLNGIKEYLKAQLRFKVQEVLKEDLDNIIEEVCKSAVYQLHSYKDNIDGTTKIILQIDGIKREIDGVR